MVLSRILPITLFGAALAGVTVCPATSPAAAQKAVQLAQSDRSVDVRATEVRPVEAIDTVWSGHRVEFAFVQKGQNQLIGYFDALRQLSLAHRRNSTDPWRYHKLPSYLGWDSHNSIAIGVDREQHIHVMANMHADRLVYFRSRYPMDVRSLEQVRNLDEGGDEAAITYPVFINDQEGRLIVKFRVGGSGNGAESYFIHDEKTHRWRRLHRNVLADGEGQRSTYFNGPTLGPDGYFHLIWVWRETPSANTNHDLSYARSRDLVNWETSGGRALNLPIRLADAEIVDPVPVGGGILNNQMAIGFDAQRRPMISYYKYDARGKTQIHIARQENSGWVQRPVTRWTDLRLNLDKLGSLANPIGIREAPMIGVDGSVEVPVMRNDQRLVYSLDPVSLAYRRERRTETVPAIVETFRQPSPMLLQIKTPTGDAGPLADRYRWMLVWSALSPSQDQAKPDIPPPSTLRLLAVPKN